MKIAVFGATGKIGQQVVSQVTGGAEDNEIIAFTRDPDKMTGPLAGVQIVKGDVLDIRAVTRAIEGSDAVICALGMPMMNNEGLRAKGTKNIVEAMKATGTRRLICLSGLGVGDSFHELPALYRYLIIPLFLRRLCADHLLQETYIKNSPLDWTIVRPASFVEGGRTGSYWHGVTLPEMPIKIKISHGDVADFLLRQLSDATYLRKTPALSYLK